MVELKGYEEPIGYERPLGAKHCEGKHRPTWAEEREAEARELGYTAQPYVVTIGGGQGGIALGARLRQLGVPTTIVIGRLRHKCPQHGRPSRHRSAMFIVDRAKQGGHRCRRGKDLRMPQCGFVGGSRLQKIRQGLYGHGQHPTRCPRRHGKAMHHASRHVQKERRLLLQDLPVQHDPCSTFLQQKELVQMLVRGNLPIQPLCAIRDRFNLKHIGKCAVFTVKVPDGNGVKRQSDVPSGASGKHRDVRKVPWHARRVHS